MKIKNSSFLVLLASLLLMSCVKEGDSLAPSGSADGLEFVGSIDAVDGARTSYDRTDEAIKIAWVKNDNIGIFSQVGGSVIDANYNYKAKSAGATTDFLNVNTLNVVEWSDETSAHNFYAYYPYSQEGADLYAVPVSVPAEMVYNDTDPLAFLSEGDFMYAAALNQTKTAVGEGNQMPLAFKHLFSVLNVRVRASQFVSVDAMKVRCTDEAEAVSFESGATVDLTTGEIDLSSAVTSNMISVTGTRSLQMNDYTDYYMLISPGHAGKTFEFVAEINGKEQVFATRTVGADGLTAGKTIVVSADLEVEDDDASTVVDLSANGTANTYYVNQPATIYKFKATVKGNGEAYSSEGLTYTAEDLQIEPKAALILWYNCVQSSTSTASILQESPIVIGSVNLNADGYIYFQTPSVFVNGNVSIIAIDQPFGYDEIEADSTYHTFSNTNVLWSWNIVASEGYDIEATAFTKGDYTFMSRNLGATIEPEQAVTGGSVNSVTLVETIGNYYQFGRKDPFPPVMAYGYRSSIYDPLWFTPTYTPITALQYENVNGKNIPDQIFGRSREEVGVFFLDFLSSSYTGEELFQFLDAKAPHRWASRSSNLYEWNYLPASIFSSVWANDDTFNSKTIYDPCPVGWRVMTEKAWDALSAEPVVAEFDYTTAQGVYVDGHYFAAYAFRNYGGSPDASPVWETSAAEIRYHIASSTLISGQNAPRAIIQIGAEDAGEGSREITFKKDSYISSFGNTLRCVKLN